MPEQFRYGVKPTYPGDTEAVSFIGWHENSLKAAEDALTCFDLGATEVDIKIVKKEVK